MDEQPAAAPGAVKEFVLADELRLVWMQNPLKGIANEIMGKTILGCLALMRPELERGLIPFDPAEKHELVSVELDSEMDMADLFRHEFWTTESLGVAGLLHDIESALEEPGGVVKESLCLMPYLFPGGWADEEEKIMITGHVAFTLTYMRRVQ